MARASAGPHGGTSVVSHYVSRASQRAALAYWTPARMRSARPVTAILARAPETASPAVGQPDGKPGRVPGGLPAGAARGAAGHSAFAAGAATFSYPFPYDSFAVPASDYTKTPWRVNGAIFFVRSGADFVCSGTSVASAHGTSDENEVWTAGHCVAEGGVFDSKAVFVPGYNGAATNIAPFGTFTATAFETSTAWLNNGDQRLDMGAMQVSVSSTTGLTLGHAVGWAGFAWNQNVSEQFVTFGYPAAAPYNQKSMIEDIGATAVSDTAIGGTGPAPDGIGSPLTAGSSGGAWFIDWSDSNPGFINGHNDYKYNAEPLAMYSPYFTSLENAVRCFGATTC